MTPCMIESLESRTLFSTTLSTIPHPAPSAPHRLIGRRADRAAGENQGQGDAADAADGDNVQQGPGNTGAGGPETGGPGDGTPATPATTPLSTATPATATPASAGRAAATAGAVVPAFVGAVPSSLATGRAIKVALDVGLTNRGQTIAKGPVTLALFASATSTPGAADTRLLSVSQKLNLKPGKSKDVKLKLSKLPAALPDGDYFLLAEVTDSSGATRTAATAAAVRIAAPFVSLHFAFAGAPPATLAQGDTATIPVMVSNAGTDVSTAPVSIAFSLAMTATPGPADLPLAMTTKRLRLKGNAVRTLKLNITVPSSIALGTYFLIARFNGSDTVVSPAALTVTVGGN